MILFISLLLLWGNIFSLFSDEEMDYVIAVAKGETPKKPKSMREREDSTPTPGRKRPSSPRGKDEPPAKQLTAG